jgi:hypothetical protein
LAERAIAFCPHLVTQAGEGLRTRPRGRQVAALADDIRASRSFSLWWD